MHKNVKLPPEVAEHFELTENWTGGTVMHFGKFGTIDLSKLNLRQAENLLKREFPGLAQKKAKPTAKS